MFIITNLNPIRWVPVVDFDPALYATIPMDMGLQKDRTPPHLITTPKEYTQKLTHTDAPVTQILSSYSGITCAIYKYCDNDGTVILTPVVTDTESQITGVAADLYEVIIDAELLDNGKYYGVISYVDENDETVNWVSEPFEVAAEWPNCLRFEYTNSTNKWSTVFQKKEDGSEVWTGVMRVEAALIEFKPSSIDSIYADEQHNVTMADSEPFRQYTLAIGGDGTGGVPDYMADRLNRIMSCDQVLIDGQYYTKSEGAQWDQGDTTNNQFSEPKIQVTESENKFTLKIDTSGITEEMMAIQDVLKFLSSTQDIVIPNKFKKHTRLEFITVFNPSGAEFDLTFQTTTQGGINDFEPQVEHFFSTDLFKDITFVWPFDRVKELTITKTTEEPLNIFVGYKKLEAAAAGSGSGNSSEGIGSVKYWHGTLEQFDLDFDTATKLGRADGRFPDWALCQGDNFTPDARDRMVIGTDGITDISTKPVGQTGGSWAKQILMTHLPVLQFALFAASPSLGTYTALSGANDVVDSQGGKYPAGSSGSFDQYRMQKNTTGLEPTVGRTNRLGGAGGDGTGGVSANFDITGKYIRMVMIKKVA